MIIRISATYIQLEVQAGACNVLDKWQHIAMNLCKDISVDQILAWPHQPESSKINWTASVDPGSCQQHSWMLEEEDMWGSNDNDEMDTQGKMTFGIMHSIDRDLVVEYEGDDDINGEDGMDKT